MKASLGERLSWCVLAAILTAACVFSTEAAQLVTVQGTSFAPQAGGSGDSGLSIISRDGRYVLFASTANNLTLTNNNNSVLPRRFNVFLRDRLASTTTLVSVNMAGNGGGNGDSFPTGISTNGQFALFESSASDLVAGDTNNASDIFVRDVVNGLTTLVSVSTNGTSGNGTSRGSVMTGNGRYVAFVSTASNLVPGDTNGIADVFVRDLQAGTTTLASVGASTNSIPPLTGTSSSVRNHRKSRRTDGMLLFTAPPPISFPGWRPLVTFSSAICSPATPFGPAPTLAPLLNPCIGSYQCCFLQLQHQ